jgi:phosphate transport system substrate-binding protein
MLSLRSVMSATPGAIIRRGGISRTVFAISLVVVAAASGLGGYFIPGLFHSTTSTVTLNGAGSTFVYPLISAMDTNYTKINPSIQVNYQAVGSGTGINDLEGKLVDFGASDAPLTGGSSGQYVTLNKTSTPLTIPDTIGAVVVAYNLPGVTSPLQLNATVTAEIFQGNITNWNDPAIAALNPSLTLPSNPITLVHRSDSSGTTFVFSGYLKSSSFWKLGQSKTISWPASAIGANGNPGVAAVIQGTKYSVGYVELDYALSASPAMTYAEMLNTAQQTYIAPTLASTMLAASTLPSLPTNGNWTQVSLLNSNTSGAYPIVTFSYIMVYQELNVYGSSMTLSRAQDLVNYLWWIVTTGQDQSAPLYYVALPSNVVSNAQATLRMITYNGQQLHS